MPDIFALLHTFWQRSLQPLASRLAFRVSLRGLCVVSGWALLIIGYSLLSLLPNVGIGSTILANALPVLKVVLLALTGLLAVALLWDYALLWWATRSHQDSFINGLHITRQANNNLSVQAWSKVSLNLFHPNPTPIGIHLMVMDNYPPQAQCEQLPIILTAKQLATQPSDTSQAHQADIISQGMMVNYQLFPNQRGFGVFDGVDILLRSSLGLLKKFVAVSEAQIAGIHQVRILANFADIVQGQLLGVSQHSSLAGLLKQKRRGQGQDFHQIRNYTEGDSIRHLDWKATSRYQRLMTREFQDEQDQQILFLLDCGQHMRHLRFFDPAQRLNQSNLNMTSSHLDQALNAMLLLAEVASRQGDATGFITFASEADKVIPPKKGQQVISYLLNQSFELQPSLQLPDYIAVARTVRTVQRKRSLLILITNTRQEEYSELTEALKLLSAKHVVILANLYEQDLADYLESRPSASDEALTYHTVQEYQNMREHLHKNLAEQTHIYPINCTPSQLPSLLIHQYLLIKHRHRL
ncbi:MULTISPECIES: DUF58 domain-containing protein [unclassified Moraxella]|uniref:DUF58 domain-containing protein n=1 Tax=unclassified Moraxella TaxID=2685852 RepID=UPI003AF714C2